MAPTTTTFVSTTVSTLLSASATVLATSIADGTAATLATPANLLKGGLLFSAVFVFSVAGYLYHGKKKADAKPKSDLRELVLPTIVSGDNTPKSFKGVKVSAPKILSSTNVAADPFFLCSGSTIVTGHIQIDMLSGNLVSAGPALENIADVANGSDTSSEYDDEETGLSPVSSDNEIFLSNIDTWAPLVIKKKLSVVLEEDEEDGVDDDASVYSQESADHDHDFVNFDAPMIFIEDQPQCGKISEAFKSYEFDSKLVGTTAREGQFLDLPELVYGYARSQPVSHVVSRRQGLVDMTKYAEALTAKPPQPIPSPPYWSIFEADEDEVEEAEEKVLVHQPVVKDTLAELDQLIDDLAAFTATDSAFFDEFPETEDIVSTVAFKPAHRRSYAVYLPTTDEILRECESLSADLEAAAVATELAQVPGAKWAPKDGMIIVKLFVHANDEIWKVKVPEIINLQRFTSKVLSKLGYHVAFSASCWDAPFETDEAFQHWLQRRIRFGRNVPLVAHIIPPP